MDKQFHIQDIYQATFRVLNDALIVINTNHEIVEINPSAETVLNITVDEARGQTLSKILQTKHQVSLSIDDLPTEPIVLKQNSGRQYFSIEQNKISDDNILLVMRDITAQQHLLDNKEKLELSYINYAHTVSHDVKSPLGVVIGYTNMLQSEIEAGTEAHFFVDEVFKTSMRILYICNELTLLAEMSRPQKPEITSMNLHTIIEPTFQRIKSDLATPNIILDTKTPIPKLLGNIQWLEEVFVNIFKLAIQSCQQPAIVTIEAKKLPQKMVRVSIQHNGQAFSDTQQSALFDGDIVLHEIRAEGVGLGMPVSKHLIELQGGEAGVLDGQTIYFTLPIDES